jgi:hypothetical protein
MTVPVGFQLDRIQTEPGQNINGYRVLFSNLAHFYL